MPNTCVALSSSGEAPTKMDSSAMPTGPSTSAGSTGRRKRNYSTDRVPNYRPHVLEGNRWIEAREREVQQDFSRGTLCHDLADNFGNGLSSFFSTWLRTEGVETEDSGTSRRPNPSGAAQLYLDLLGLGVEDMFHHVVAVLHDPAYREANVGALRIGWPRIPLPDWPDGHAEGAEEELARSAARGRELARLLDPGTPVPGVTTGALSPEAAAIAVPATADGRNMAGDDFAAAEGWGHFGAGKAVMLGQGRIEERTFTVGERSALGGATATFGERTFDVCLNDRAFWRNVPAAVWDYKLGGYQVLKKWLSYREQEILRQVLLPEEFLYFTDAAGGSP